MAYPGAYYYAYSGDDAAELLAYIEARFGYVSSFSGTYTADKWELTITRNTGNYTCVKN